MLANIVVYKMNFRVCSESKILIHILNDSVFDFVKEKNGKIVAAYVIFLVFFFY